MNQRSYSYDLQTDLWLQAKVVNHFPLSSILLRIAATPPPDHPALTLYLIGEIGGQRLPFGIDHPESLEEAFADAAERFDVNESDWSELASEPQFVEVFDEAIEKAVERAADAVAKEDEEI